MKRLYFSIKIRRKVFRFYRQDKYYFLAIADEPKSIDDEYQWEIKKFITLDTARKEARRIIGKQIMEVR